MKETAIVYYSENGEIKTKEIPLPKKCIGDHAETCDYIDEIMGGNDKWNSYDIKEQL